jgi:CRP/FNR family cyclic AMP-dependent transcriptional regulator
VRDHHGVSEQSLPSVAAEPRWSPQGVRLLEVEPDLGARLTETERQEVERHVVLPVARLERGPWNVDQLGQPRGVWGEPRGFLVLTGHMCMDLAVGEQVCTRLITARELVLLDDRPEDSLPVRAGWWALDPATVAVLDHRLSIIAARWPGLMHAILERAAQQMRLGLLQQAISQLPRVEDRLLALLWSIADRQGVVRADGVYVPLPATHATLAQMVGARRPTVSLGLRALTARGLLQVEEGGWLLSRESLGEFSRPQVRSDIPGG